MTKHQLLHVSGLTAPSTGNTNFTKKCNCNYSKGFRRKY